jgi:3-dehydrosphinganine reductase
MSKIGTHFQGKNIIITGGSSGIGQATAKLLARHGANVYIVARNQERLDRTLQEIEAEGISGDQRHGAWSADVTDSEEVDAAIGAIVGTGGSPDILINSAGIVYPGYFEKLPLSTFRHQMDVNYFGTLHTVKAVLPRMMDRGSGHIVNISSIGGIFGGFGYSAYGASKFAVSGFTESLRAELKPHGIAVSLVLPPDTATPQLREEKRVRPIEIDLVSGTGKPEKLEGLSEVIAYWLAKTVLSDSGDPISPEAVAQAIVQGIRRRRFLIFPDATLKAVFYFRGLLFPVASWIQDKLVAAARRQKQG